MTLQWTRKKGDLLRKRIDGIKIVMIWTGTMPKYIDAYCKAFEYTFGIELPNRIHWGF